MTTDPPDTELIFEPAIRDLACRSFTDYMAVTLAASRDCQPEELVRRLVAGFPGYVPSPVGSYTTNIEKAALAWGFCAHYLDYDDISQSTIAHPSAVIFSALVPTAFEQNRTGREVLTAYLSGLDFMTRHGHSHADAIYAAGWHTTSVLGTIGATRALAVLAELSPDQEADAIGLVSSLASGLQVNFGTTTKPLHAGWAAAASIFALEAVRAGIGSSAEALAGKSGLLAVAGDGYRGVDPVDLASDLVLKPYPSCGYSLRLIDAALALHGRLADETVVGHVTCSLSPRADQVLRYAAPASANEARFSAEYVVASGLLEGHVGLDTFDRVGGSGIPATVRSLMSRVERIVDDTITSLADERATVEITTRSGETLREEVTVPVGHPSNPMPESVLRRKFLDCVSHRWSGDEVDRRFDATRGIDSDQKMRRYLESMLDD